MERVRKWQCDRDLEGAVEREVEVHIILCSFLCEHCFCESCNGVLCVACVASLGDPLLVQVTKMYEDAVRERDSVVTRLARMDSERRELIDTKEEGEKRARDLSKVHTYVHKIVHTHCMYKCKVELIQCMHPSLLYWAIHSLNSLTTLLHMTVWPHTSDAPHPLSPYPPPPPPPPLPLLQTVEKLQSQVKTGKADTLRLQTTVDRLVSHVLR